MSNLVFVTGGFSSGSTLLFTLFRRSGEFYSLYEPLHEHLPVFMFSALRTYEHHYFVGNYFAEYRGFSAIPRLHDEGWGRRGFHLDADDHAPALYRYLSYLVGTAFGRRGKVMLQFNRASFRLPWLRARFPEARVIHIYRDRDRQWQSIVRRTQLTARKEDVGQSSTSFNGMGIANWCDDLAGRFPQLRAEASSDGYERFSKLWDLAFRSNEAHADISVAYEDLVGRFHDVMEDVWRRIGAESDWRSLERWVVRPSGQRSGGRRSALTETLVRGWDRLRWRYGEWRVRLARARSPGPRAHG